MKRSKMDEDEMRRCDEDAMAKARERYREMKEKRADEKKRQIDEERAKVEKAKGGSGRKGRRKEADVTEADLRVDNQKLRAEIGRVRGLIQAQEERIHGLRHRIAAQRRAGRGALADHD
jgi:hypothetical protein